MPAPLYQRAYTSVGTPRHELEASTEMNDNECRNPSHQGILERLADEVNGST